MSQPSTEERHPGSPVRMRDEDDLYSWVQEQAALLRAGATGSRS